MAGPQLWVDRTYGPREPAGTWSSRSMSFMPASPTLGRKMASARHGGTGAQGGPVAGKGGDAGPRPRAGQARGSSKSSLGPAPAAVPAATPTTPVTPGRRLLPEATVRRLPLYLRALASAGEEHQATVSSEELATRAGVNAAQVRKDLSYLGSYGTRGIGYRTESLRQHLSRELGLEREYNVALVGAGNLGQALGHYRGFAERGFQVVAAFDTDPAKVGGHIGGTEIFPLGDLGRVVNEKGITMALVATPATAAQEVVERLVDAGVTSVLNFAPALLNVAADISLRRVDLAVELQILSYYDSSRQHSVLRGRGEAVK